MLDKPDENNKKGQREQEKIFLKKIEELINSFEKKINALKKDQEKKFELDEELIIVPKENINAPENTTKTSPAGRDTYSMLEELINKDNFPMADNLIKPTFKIEAPENIPISKPSAAGQRSYKNIDAIQSWQNSPLNPYRSSRTDNCNWGLIFFLLLLGMGLIFLIIYVF